MSDVDALPEEVERGALNLPYGRITDKGIDQIRQMAGIKLRPEQYLRDASQDTMTNFSIGIGDVNPLYHDLEYSRWTRFGGLIAHPMYPIVHEWPSRTRWGLPGVHGFGAGADFEFFRNVRAGDRVNAYDRILGVEDKVSKFSRRLVIQYTELVFTNQRDELLCRAVTWCTRHERDTAKAEGKYKEITTYQYKPDELAEIEAMILREPQNVRGIETRYWDDVPVGEVLPTIARGPLTTQQTMGFVVACGRVDANYRIVENAQKHPMHYVRNPEAGGGLEYTGIGHHKESVAKEVGVPGAYDYGPQRHAWVTSLVTNWMGDDAFLKQIRSEWRRFNVAGDTQFCKGKVAGKRIVDGYGLVDIELWAENQRGEVTTPGTATVILPRKDPRSSPFVIDGRDLTLGLRLPQA